MIVKNEAKSIRAVLEAALPHVDRYTILDTGSTDDTVEIVNEVRNRFLDKLGTVFVEETSEFRFDTARNRVMQLDAASDGSAEFTLMLSGDEYLRDGAKLREHLEQHRDSDVDCHWLKLVIDGARNFQARVLRTGSAWRYESDLPMGLHEFPANREDPGAKSVGVPGAYIDHVVSDEGARLDNIWERHIPLLRQKLEEDPCNERALTFLAQSYRALFHFFDDQEKVRYAFEMMGLYLRRLALPTGIEAERNYIRLQFIDAAQYTSVYTAAELLRRAQELAADDPTRPEVALLCARLSMSVLPSGQVYALAAHAAKVAEASDGVDNSLSMSTDIAWKAHHLAAAVAKQISRKRPGEMIDDRTYAELMREHVSAGMRAGGEWETFKNIVIDAESVSA
jgi:glycosyltransferase involved in cell wall biosynthesis